MEALGILKFWQNAVADDENDSFFDMVFKPSTAGESFTKDFRFIESPKPLSPAVTLFRSTPKLKVFMLGFRKTRKSQKSELTAELKAIPLNRKSSKDEQSNRLSPKCEVEEVVVSSILTRDCSSKSRVVKESSDANNFTDVVSAEKSVPMYVKLMRPFHLKSSKKAKVTDFVTPNASPVTAPLNLSPIKPSEGCRVGNLKTTARNLVKSRSASASRAAIGAATPSYRRRDDSLLEQHDGILGAILHCKKSYTSSSKEFSQLSQSAIDPSVDDSGPASAGRSSL